MNLLNACFRLVAGLSLALVGMTAPPAFAAPDPFAEGVRPTDPLTPAQQLKTFHLPPGFEMQLVAAEPDLRKPMNLAFDSLGRLWVTESREYPYPAKLNQPARDSVRVFSDFDDTGRARKVTIFADGLNIPTGVYPFRSPRGGGGAGLTWKCIVWSIPNIWLMEDTDGDGKADKREVLFGPLGWERDTHGNLSSFRRGFDGWLYGTHGFNNNSTFKARDGSTITVNSGNTWRIRPDGSRVEQHTWGQVNPFGLCFDPHGNLYSADCHSSPVYQLLRGASYPSFGKPDDGLGFAPLTIQHSHGSTAISGIVFISDPAWPAELQNSIFVGNVMTSRINRDAITFAGTSSKGKEMSDFLSTDDPWFRPVDLQIGPDGALYVADFYNRIIGHYEVPLDHPGRDRERGRLWRIVYRGPHADGGKQPAAPSTALPADAAGLVAELASPNQTRRMIAMNELVDAIGQPAVKPLQRAISRPKNAHQHLHAMWTLERLGALSDKSLGAAIESKDALVRTHAVRLLGERARWSAAQSKLVLAAVRDADAFVQRAAAEALALHPDAAHARPLLEARQAVPAADDHRLHATRIALRNQLYAAGAFEKVGQASRRPEPRSGSTTAPRESGAGGRDARPALGEADARAVADVAVAVTNAAAASFLLAHLQQHVEPRETMTRYLKHAVRYLPEGDLDSLARFSREKFAGDLELQASLFKSVQDGLGQRGAKLSPATRAWGADLAANLLAASGADPKAWHNTPLEGMKDTTNPWFVQKRVSKDGDRESRFFCSLPPGGESLTGVLRSPVFAVPAKLSFYVAGHDGFPDKPAQKKNVVRLRATSGAVLAEAPPPRNDTAQPVTWDLTAHAGQQAQIEVVDGDTGGAYAWLALGRFEPAVVTVPKTDPSAVAKRQLAAAELARALNLAELEPQLNQLLASRNTDLEVRAAAARALLAFKPNDQLAALTPLLADREVPVALREKVSQALVTRAATDGLNVLLEALRASPRRLQIKLAESLAGSPTGAGDLLDLVSKGQAPAVLLLERPVKEKLSASRPADGAARVKELTRGLSAPNDALQKLIDERRKAYASAKAQPVEGARVFVKNCAVCHQIEGQGGLVGPQLDGIGNRGLERLCEDVIDPNRNVDHAFRSTLLVLKDGDVVSGLFRREEGETVVLADSTGKEVSVPKKQIVERRESESSLMPENLAELISAEEFQHLLAYLLSKGSQARP